jgi:hypothetical protein
MNLYNALLVIEKEGWALRQSESYADSADTLVKAIGAAIEGISETDLEHALAYAFQDTRPDMKLRAMAFLGVLLGMLTNTAAEIRVATPEVWPKL